MKVLLINGSPHKDGCTNRALNEVMETLEKNGIESELIWIGTDAIHGCIACGGCADTKKCGFDDVATVISEKMAELGVGERVLQQVADTAVGIITDVVNPLSDYLEKYEKVFDENVYNAEIQAYAKQMFFASQAMKQDAAENVVGQNFVLDM